ncbi:hypothetical protein BSKO_11774 [Bryopsis sp. KO-2023]|nr:hypothetical protein BSKO_11774 [Bryopsis sp. KO-2023]
MAAAGDGFIRGDVFWLDGFALRQWDDESYQGTRMNFDKVEFTKRIHEAHAKGSGLVDGYAPFCKHVFVENFTDARVGNLEITESNKNLLECGYSRRRPEELAVLSRSFPKDKVDPPVAAYLDIILYSREQLAKEYSALERSGKTAADLPDVPWGIISVKAQMENFETPMQPITMMRNALGVAEGGSSVPLDKAKYEESVAYWENHATIS